MLKTQLSCFPAQALERKLLYWHRRVLFILVIGLLLAVCNTRALPLEPPTRVPSLLFPILQTKGCGGKSQVMTKATKARVMAINSCFPHSFSANSGFRNVLGARIPSENVSLLLVFTLWWENLFLGLGDIFLTTMKVINVAPAIALGGFWLVASEVLFLYPSVCHF